MIYIIIYVNNNKEQNMMQSKFQNQLRENQQLQRKYNKLTKKASIVEYAKLEESCNDYAYSFSLLWKQFTDQVNKNNQSENKLKIVTKKLRNAENELECEHKARRCVEEKLNKYKPMVIAYKRLINEKDDETASSYATDKRSTATYKRSKATDKGSKSKKLQYLFSGLRNIGN